MSNVAATIKEALDKGLTAATIRKTNATFELWYKVVDKVISSQIGLSRDDISDKPYRDWYDKGMTAQTAGKKAVKDELAEF